MISLRFFVLLILGALALGNPEEDLVTDLPGLDFPVNYRQYSGYLNGSDTIKLHYWFVESQGDPDTDPIVLWLNGGPGCSSLMGFLTELGPFRVVDDGSNTLEPNTYSWNTAANVIFMESPACVGFSYDENNSCRTGDNEVAEMNYLALQEWFSKFPQFMTRDFYVTGESYGGIYVPTLSQKIVEGLDTFPVQFAGYAIGNGLYTYNTNDNSLLFFAYYHAIFSQSEWDNMVAACCDGGIENQESCDFAGNAAPTCQVLVEDAMVKIYSTGLNEYNLYDDCAHESELRPSEYAFAIKNIFKKHSWMSKLRQPETRADPPCTDSAATRTWLNTASVRDALHIPTTVRSWEVCSNEVAVLYKNELDSTVPNLTFLQSSGVRGMIYNGDVDMACNFLGNLWDITGMNLTSTAVRRQWSVRGQVSGYVDRWENLDFVTVKGSGHMVPQDKPEEALHMINSFFTNTPI